MRTAGSSTTLEPGFRITTVWSVLTQTWGGEEEWHICYQYTFAWRLSLTRVPVRVVWEYIMNMEPSGKHVIPLNSDKTICL